MSGKPEGAAGHFNDASAFGAADDLIREGVAWGERGARGLSIQSLSERGFAMDFCDALHELGAHRIEDCALDEALANAGGAFGLFQETLEFAFVQTEA